MTRPSRKTNSNTRVIDQLVGRQLRRRRLELGFSQLRLAEEMGVTFQQIQKYELGANRVVASRLYDLACVLDVPVAYFFTEADPEDLREASDGDGDAGEDFGEEPSPQETRRLIKAYYAIENPQLRKKLIDLVRSVAAGES